MNQYLTSGQRVAVILYLLYCEITASVRVEANGPGKIPVQIPLKAVPDPKTGLTSELTARIISADRWV